MFPDSPKTEPLHRVFVVQQTQVDYTSAAKFGRLEPPILPQLQNVALSTLPTIREFRSRFHDFNDKDYLLLVGDPVAIGIAVAVAAELNKGRVNVLKWDKHSRSYIEISLNIKGR